MKKYLKYIFIIATCSNLIGCVHIKTPAENLQDLKDGKVGAVISGCEFHTKKGSKEPCKINLLNVYDLLNQNRLSIDNYTSINFVPPGNYRFWGFSARYQPWYSDYYTDYSFYAKKEESYLQNFSIKGGEIIYIGDFNIDLRKSKFVVHLLEPTYLNREVKSKLLRKKFPSYFSKDLQKSFPQYFNDNFQLDYKERFVGLTPSAKAAKAIPVLE